MKRTRVFTTAMIAAAAILAAAPTTAHAQSAQSASVASGAHVQEFSFGAGSDVSSARLVLVPFAYQARLTDGLVLDGYAAYAAGEVRSGNSTFELHGPVDSWARLRWSLTPWAIAAVGVSLPTGVERHSPEEAVVANVLSSDLLGFREGNWGAGASATAGISTAHAVGAARMTMGLSYRFVGSFDPRSDSAATYAPGNETRMRVGLGTNISGGHLETGITVQHFSVDRLNQRNLFQSGTRLRADLGYDIGGWSVYAADLWRARGELTLPVLNVIDGSAVRDTSMTVGWQNLALGGISGSLPIGHGYIIQPMVEAKARQRSDVAGRGWIASVGAGLPFRVLGLDAFPQVKLSRGSLMPSDSSGYRTLWGGEFSVVFRRGW